MEDTWEDSKDISRRLRVDLGAVLDGWGSTAGDDTSNISEETSGNTEEESSDVLTPSVDTTAQGMSKKGCSIQTVFGWVL